MTRRRVAIGVGVLAAVFGGAHAFMYFTGDCPLRCLMRHIHGEPAATAPAQPAKSAS